MKKILLIFVSITSIFISCGKEDTIQNHLVLENVFEIKDDSNDPIHKRIFQIYNKYSVPVFFNDTIGQVFIMNDVQGNPIYSVEKIDLAWTFTNYSKQKYEFEYMTKYEEKNTSLDIIEAYLEDASPSLHPFSFFVTRSGKKTDQGKVVEEFINGKFYIGFRTVYMTGEWKEGQMDEIPYNLKRQMILDKILNYPDDITEFSIQSKSVWYGGRSWNELDSSIPGGWKEVDALYDDWAGAKWYTEEELKIMRSNARKVIGKFGFVKGNSLTKGLQSPSNPNDELKDYINEILKYGPVKFEELWGTHPIVMKKYSILVNVIQNKMNVKL